MSFTFNTTQVNGKWWAESVSRQTRIWQEISMLLGLNTRICLIPSVGLKVVNCIWIIGNNLNTSWTHEIRNSEVKLTLYSDLWIHVLPRVFTVVAVAVSGDTWTKSSHRTEAYGTVYVSATSSSAVLCTILYWQGRENQESSPRLRVSILLTMQYFTHLCPNAL